MKKISILLIVLAAAISCPAAYQYNDGNFYWDQANETSNQWNFHLDVWNDNVYKAYGIYYLSEGLDSRITLQVGDNIVNLTGDIGFWVLDGNNGKIFTVDTSKRFGVDMASSIVEVHGGNSLNSTISGIITVSSTDGGVKTSGQPLPGVLLSLCLGGSVAGAFGLKKKFAHKQ